MLSKLKILILIFISVFSITIQIHAQKKNVFNECQEYIAPLKQWKRYGYKANMNVPIAQANARYMERTIYIDKLNKNIFYSDLNQVLLVNNVHIVQIDHGQKSFKIFDRKEYERIYSGKANNINSLFKDDILNQVIDTFLVHQKQCKLVQENNGVKKFRSMYRDNILETVLEINVESKSKLIKEMNFTAFDVSDNNSLVYTVKMSDYQFDFDKKVFSTDAYFKVLGINKYQLLQYKDYKLLTKVK